MGKIVGRPHCQDCGRGYVGTGSVVSALGLSTAPAPSYNALLAQHRLRQTAPALDNLWLTFTSRFESPCL